MINNALGRYGSFAAYGFSRDIELPRREGSRVRYTFPKPDGTSFGFDNFWLSPETYARLKVLAGSKMTLGGELLITARRFRTQEGNREDARRRLAALITEAHIVQAKRRPTKPSRAAKARRVDAKKGRATVKAGRGKVSWD